MGSSVRSDAIVIGGGVGGMAAAIDLARRGVGVTLLERQGAVGGKLRVQEVAGRAVDAGPTVLTMRWVFEELFADAGADFASALPLVPASILARHAWDERGHLDLFADLDASVDAISAFAGPDEGRGYRAFAAYAKRIFEATEATFLRAQRPGPLALVKQVGRHGPGTVAAIDPFRTLWRALGEFFRDPRLVQLFGRYATYAGSSPFDAPATLNVIAHVEREGVFYVRGGMYALASALRALAERHGVRIVCGAEVAELLTDRRGVRGVRLASGEVHEADAVICNADAAALGAGLFGEAARKAVPGSDAPRSLSATTFSVLATPGGFPLVRHSVFFSSDYAREFAELDAGRLPTEPTVYVCAQDREDGAPATGGPERLFLLVNAPAVGEALESNEVTRCREAMLAKLRACGLSLSIEPGAEAAATPATFARLFPATGGALYGPATKGILAPLARPGARTKLPGLYLAGGSVHPGAGVPMATLSGRRAAEALLEDRPSIGRSRPAATPGGTSTSPATTAASARR